MLRAFTYGMSPELTTAQYREIRQHQGELEQLYIDDEDIDITTLVYQFLTKLLGRTLLVFIFFVAAFLLRKYNILG